eukprot:1153942-Pelagomonas_calceolata.AAC.5
MPGNGKVHVEGGRIPDDDTFRTAYKYTLVSTGYMPNTEKSHGLGHRYSGHVGIATNVSSGHHYVDSCPQHWPARLSACHLLTVCK